MAKVNIFQHQRLRFQEATIQWIEKIVDYSSSEERYKARVWFRNNAIDNTSIHQLAQREINQNDFNTIFEFKDLAAKELWRLVVGSVWSKEGECLKHNNELYRRRETLAILKKDLGQLPQRFHQAIGIEKMPEKRSTISLQFDFPLPSDTLRSYCLKIKNPNFNGNNIRYFILPCTELARFFFFHSNNLTLAIFNLGLESLFEYCTDENGKPIFPIQKGSDIIGYLDNIAEGWSQKEINTIGRIAFVKNAKSAASYIWNSLAKELSDMERVIAKWKEKNPTQTWLNSAAFKTRLPSDDAFNLDLCGETITYNGITYFLVFQIYHSDAKLPFDMIEYTLKIDRRSQEEIENPKDTIIHPPRTLIRNHPKALNKIDDTKLPNSQSIETALEFEIKAPPPVFEIPPLAIVEKTEKTGQEGRHRRDTNIIQQENDQHSTNANSESGAKEGKANVGDRLPPPTKEEMREVFNKFIEAIELLNRSSYKTLYLNLSDGKESDEVIYNNWIFGAAKHQTELLVVQVTKDIQVSPEKRVCYFYLIRFKMLWTEKPRTVLIQQLQCQQLTIEEIKLLLVYFSNGEQPIPLCSGEARSLHPNLVWFRYNISDKVKPESITANWKKVLDKETNKIKESSSQLNE